MRCEAGRRRRGTPRFEDPTFLHDCQYGVVVGALHSVPSSKTTCGVRPARDVHHEVEERNHQAVSSSTLKYSDGSRGRRWVPAVFVVVFLGMGNPSPIGPVVPTCHGGPGGGPEGCARGPGAHAAFSGVHGCRCASQRALNCLAMCCPKALASGIGTALPICLVIWVRDPTNW